MNEIPSDVAFTETVKAIQARKGSRDGYARMEQKGGWRQSIDGSLAEVIASRDFFYFGTANGAGQPYIQHRGGPPGFLKQLDARTLAFADFTGNKQYISQGNLEENPQAFIFLMDYAKRQRIKIWGRARVVEDDHELLSQLAEDGYKAKLEQAIVFEIEAWDVNCPQHITQRFTRDEIAVIVAPLQQRITELETALAELGVGA